VTSDTHAPIGGEGHRELPVGPDGVRSATIAAPAVEAHGRVRRDGQVRQDPRVLAAVAIGGFSGGLARYGIGLAAPARHGGFPAATFAINVSGSFILALLVVFVTQALPPTTYVRPLLGVGFCGALTTFSTWMLDTDRLLGAGGYVAAAGDLFGSAAAGLAATGLGLGAGRAVAAYRVRRAREAAPEPPAVAA
jgi:CrcB protein